MDDFRVEVRPKGYPARSEGDLVVQAIINGKIVKDDDYCLDIDTFFSAMEKHGAEITLLGSCGDKGCCGEAYYAFPTAECWNWGWNEVEFRLHWSDVYQAAVRIVAEVEKLAPGSGWPYTQMHPRLPFYHEKIQEVKSLMDAVKAQASKQHET